MSDERIQRRLLVLKDALELERRGHAFYLQAAEATKDPRGKNMFLTLARDELDHLRFLDEAFRSLMQGGTWPKMPEPAKVAPRQSPRRPEVFASPKQAAAEVKPSAGELDALKRGMEAEEDSIALYGQALARAASDDEKRLFGALVAVEEGHRAILQAEYDHITRTGFWFDFQEFNLESAG